jgi:hypothetical protein
VGGEQLEVPGRVGVADDEAGGRFVGLRALRKCRKVELAGEMRLAFSQGEDRQGGRQTIRELLARAAGSVDAARAFQMLIG